MQSIPHINVVRSPPRGPNLIKPGLNKGILNEHPPGNTTRWGSLI